MRNEMGLLFLLVLAALVAAPQHQPARACAVAPHAGGAISIRDEDALIVWDAATQTEHFLRKARFEFMGNDRADFGFLVPTPTQPTLSEADPLLFSNLSSFTAPPIERVIHYERRKQQPDASAGAHPPPNAMAVLEQKTLAGYDAAVLKATDVGALTDWLRVNDFDYRPELADWLKIYVDNGWIITAFKVSAEQSGNHPELGLVRISFQTPTPFYPYREPKPDPKAAKDDAATRKLRLFVLANERMDGTIGKEGPAWPGKVQWSDQLLVAQQQTLNQRLKIDELNKPGIWWLTEFDDQSSPRPATDEVYLHKSDNQTALHRPAIQVHDTVYVDSLPVSEVLSTNPVVIFSTVLVFLGGGLLGAFLIFLRYRKRK